jgi:hypothetical protein
VNFVDTDGLGPASCHISKYTPVFIDDYSLVYDEDGELFVLGDDGNYERVEVILAELPIGQSKLIKGLDATKKVQDLLKGTGQIPALLRNKNLAGVDTQGLCIPARRLAKSVSRLHGITGWVGQKTDDQRSLGLRFFLFS